MSDAFQAVVEQAELEPGENFGVGGLVVLSDVERLTEDVETPPILTVHVGCPGDR
ncbi:hypothetical protein [Microbacterium sp. SA39]|uniref:hypothetical protein n=1 Tax=Microbacterium sp. SA39 TaxID=1263625 RepID=UPI001364BE87|nr:hypothetical protein [Microbacterium sp. SA39]